MRDFGIHAVLQTGWSTRYFEALSSQLYARRILLYEVVQSMLEANVVIFEPRVCPTMDSITSNYPTMVAHMMMITPGHRDISKAETRQASIR